MNEKVVKNGKELRCGYTTGSCAAAAAKACAVMLLSGEMIDAVVIDTPSGITLMLQVEEVVLHKGWASCAVVKDAGDDPDVTDGIKISARVELTQEDIRIDGGKGVGRVTREGLPCPVGEAAINPVPRQMITVALVQTAQKYGYPGGFSVMVSAKNGEEIAEKTFNPRLGIVGGISILGTSGIVEPMSEKALIETIRLEINSKVVKNREYLLVSPGNYGRDFALKEFGLDIDTGVKCSNYIGETIDYAVFKKVKNIVLIGHAGKLCKIAGGIMNTHSRIADCRCEIFAAHAALAGASRTQVEQIMQAVTTEEVAALLESAGLFEKVFKSILDKAEFYLNQRATKDCKVEVVMFINKSGTYVETAGAREAIKRLLKEGIF